MCWVECRTFQSGAPFTSRITKVHNSATYCTKHCLSLMPICGAFILCIGTNDFSFSTWKSKSDRAGIRYTPRYQKYRQIWSVIGNYFIPRASIPHYTTLPLYFLESPSSNYHSVYQHQRFLATKVGHWAWPLKPRTDICLPKSLGVFRFEQWATKGRECASDETELQWIHNETDTKICLCFNTFQTIPVHISTWTMDIYQCAFQQIHHKIYIWFNKINTGILKFSACRQMSQKCSCVVLP